MSSLLEAVVKMSSNWTRGPNIRVLTAKGVVQWQENPEFKKEHTEYARNKTAHDGVPTEIRAEHSEGELLFRADPPVK